jgi:hypothetical protein
MCGFADGGVGVVDGRRELAGSEGVERVWRRALSSEAVRQRWR